MHKNDNGTVDEHPTYMNDIYTYTVPVFIKLLSGLKQVLTKAKADADAGKFEESMLVNDRLAPDMFPFKKQVQVATDHAKGAAGRLSGVDAPKYEDTEETLTELIARVDKTIEYLNTVTEESFRDAKDRKITLSYFPGKYMTGFDYAREYAIPNVYFHTTIAYALVRKNDVAVGKADYVTSLPFQDA